MRQLVKQEDGSSVANDMQEKDDEPPHRELDADATAVRLWNGQQRNDCVRGEGREAELQRAHADTKVEAFWGPKQARTSQEELAQCRGVIARLQAEISLKDAALSARDTEAIATGCASAAGFQSEIASLQAALRAKCEELYACNAELTRICGIVEAKDKIISRLQAESQSQRRVKAEAPEEDAKPIVLGISQNDASIAVCDGSAPLSTGTGVGGKFDTFVMPSGHMVDFYKGLSSRIGFPHLEFFKTMEAEHCSMAGCDMPFTTRNYGITTTANAEWGVVVRGQTPPPEHMMHGRVTVSVEEKLKSREAVQAGLRREEVIAVILYTGPMYMIYNCVLARWSNPAAMWDMLHRGNNLFTTTLSVLVSAVQKLSAITVIPDGLKLYRGTGGLACLPDHFSQSDEFNCRGMTEWGFMSCSADKQVAMGYSGAAEGRPHAMVLEIEPSFVDRGAVVSEFSQYPAEVETLFLPMSFVAQSGQRHLERSETGEVTVIPVRVSVNLKAERLEQLEEKKKSIHLTGFEFRVNELRQKLQRLATEGNAEARLKRDKDIQGEDHKKDYSVEGFCQAQVKKVETVLLRHQSRAAADYSDEDVFRTLVSESLEVARMAESALLWWLRDKEQHIFLIENWSLLLCQRSLESFLKLQCKRSDGGHRAAIMECCRNRNLLRVDANERDENGETPLIALAARGGSADDVRLLVAAGADMEAVAGSGRSAMHWASRQGHADVVKALARAGANCNQADVNGGTPLWAGSMNGHLRCVEVLLKAGADVNKAKDNGVTPLFIASNGGHFDVVDALVRGGAAVNQVTHAGSSSLFVASYKGHVSCVEALLRARADLSLEWRGQTSLDIASKYGHLEVIKIIQAATASCC
jgi:ankyrin repeat protein